MIHDLKNGRRDGAGTGSRVFARKTQNTVLAYVGFWCSGILGWRPEKRGFGAPARHGFGTWHVAIWIFGAKTGVAGRDVATGAWGRGTIVQNEANRPERGTEAVSNVGPVSVRLIFMAARPAFVMLSNAKHLGGE
jgi:hypothetical protein